MTSNAQTTNTQQSAQPSEIPNSSAALNRKIEELQKKRRRKEHPVLKAIIWLLICLAVVFLGTVVSCYIARFDNVIDMYAWIFSQIQAN